MGTVTDALTLVDLRRQEPDLRLVVTAIDRVNLTNGGRLLAVTGLVQDAEEVAVVDPVRVTLTDEEWESAVADIARPDGDEDIDWAWDDLLPLELKVRFTTLLY